MSHQMVNKWSFGSNSFLNRRNACGIGMANSDDLILAVDDYSLKESRLLALPGNLLLLGSGKWEDAKHFLQMACYEAEMFRFSYKEDIGAELLCHRLSIYARNYYQRNRYTYLDALILCGTWNRLLGPKILKVDGSGTVEKIRACATGSFPEKAFDMLAPLHFKSLSLPYMGYKSKEIIDKVNQKIKVDSYLLNIGILGKVTNGKVLINPPNLLPIPDLGEITKTDPEQFPINT